MCVFVYVLKNEEIILESLCTLISDSTHTFIDLDIVSGVDSYKNCKFNPKTHMMNVPMRKTHIFNVGSTSPLPIFFFLIIACKWNLSHIHPTNQTYHKWNLLMEVQVLGVKTFDVTSKTSQKFWTFKTIQNHHLFTKRVFQNMPIIKVFPKSQTKHEEVYDQAFTFPRLF